MKSSVTKQLATAVEECHAYEVEIDGRIAGVVFRKIGVPCPLTPKHE